MAEIKNEEMYNSIMSRIDELVLRAEGAPARTINEDLELEMLVELAAEYEDENIKMVTPSLSEVIEEKMYTDKLTQKEFAQLLEISPSRLSELMNGKAVPTFKTAQKMFLEFKFDPAIILSAKGCKESAEMA